ncbi:hypothetical protein [Chitinophaga cymbidii]|nr:hypothetical protein [Chitinophaga cymbidii]
MKKIKLAVLAGALVLSAAGGYANYQMRSQYYYIVPNTPVYNESYKVALEEPSGNCVATGYDNVCLVNAASGYEQGDFIPSTECIVVSTYP